MLNAKKCDLGLVDISWIDCRTCEEEEEEEEGDEEYNSSPQPFKSSSAV